MALLTHCYYCGSFADIKPLVPVVSARRESRAPVDSDFVANAVPASCNAAVTPACLQDLYGIPSTPATQSSNQIGVSGFIDQFANQADLAVSFPRDLQDP